MYKTLIVLDSDTRLGLEKPDPEMISFDNYLSDYPKHNEPNTRIINLCETKQYLSKGYYCSLLAEARSHRVLPSVRTINTLKHLDPVDLEPFLKGVATEYQPAVGRDYFVFFGKSDEPDLQKLANSLFVEFPVPILRCAFTEQPAGLKLSIEPFTFSLLDSTQKQRFAQRLEEFTQTVWRTGARKKRHRWEMAILVNPQEKVPPSNKEAINRFVKAAAKQGIKADVLSESQISNISYYDALFIRETTAIDHYTYRMASKAEKAGLIVIDDPVSILRCCNKVFLHDAFSYQKVPSPKTEVVGNVHQDTIEDLEKSFDYPMVLKMPVGSFSKGVFKVKDRAELSEKLSELLKDSALALVQEYLYTEFDWRIGILNGRAIYACRYQMARNHWQIYNHDSSRFFSGGFETLPTFEVPKPVLDAAIKAAKIVGNGLYGVDVKEKDNKAWVLEVNDNPSIEHKVEDGYLGNELYMQIMAEFQRRLESRGLD